MVDILIKGDTLDVALEKGFFTSFDGWGVVLPTQSLLQKWLRDEHSVYVTVAPFYDDEDGKVEWDGYIIVATEGWDGMYLDPKDSYEEALESALQKALTFVKQ